MRLDTWDIDGGAGRELTGRVDKQVAAAWHPKNGVLRQTHLLSAARRHYGCSSTAVTELDLRTDFSVHPRAALPWRVLPRLEALLVSFFPVDVAPMVSHGILYSRNAMPVTGTFCTPTLAPQGCGYISQLRRRLAKGVRSKENMQSTCSTVLKGESGLSSQ